MRIDKRRAVLALLLAIVAGLSWCMRDVHHRRVPAIAPGGGWITTDPDSHYHMRRVERALDDGLSVAGSDPWMCYPAGADILWPPYYTLFVSAVLAPFAPDGFQARHAWIERSVASLPLVLGVLTTLVAAVAGFAIAGEIGALTAATYHALTMAAIDYAASANGDHHAWISLLAGALRSILTLGLCARALASPRSAFGWGAAAGALAGVLLGSWVASLLYVLEVELVLAVLLVRHGWRRLAGLPALGLAFHLSALLVLWPAVWVSPWRITQPWSVLNLSWFQPAILSLGGLVFVPLFWIRSPRARRSYPWLALAGLAVVSLAAASDSTISSGVRASIQWLNRDNEFMATVGESRPLIGRGTGTQVFEVLGWGMLALPFAWIGLVVALVRRDDLSLLPWVVAIPLLAFEAARQSRFAETLALPAAVGLGFGAQALTAHWRGSRAAALAMVLAAVALAQAPTLARTMHRLRATSVTTASVPTVGFRGACEWLRRTAPSRGDASVLAAWTRGHTVEWAAGWPTVATNFGSYLGEESFRAPARFLVSEDPAEGEAILARYRSRFVIVDTALPRWLSSLIQSGAPERRGRYLDLDSATTGNVREAWFRTLGARLMFDGAVFVPSGTSEGALDFLRLVYVSPLRDPDRPLRSPSDASPAAWIWELVPGAFVETTCGKGESLCIHFEVAYPRGHHTLVHETCATAADDGIARLRVPYATDAPNGDGIVQAGAWWRVGSRGGALAIPERAVLEGRHIRLE